MTDPIIKDQIKPNSGKILLVEDDPMVVRMYARKFKKEGFGLALAYNGEKGLEELKKERPDIILLDIMMPKMSGLEMLKIVKDDPQYKDLPVVMLTNLGDRAEDVKKCKELGAEDYWVKANMQLNEITDKVKKILAKYFNK
jgi:Response regulators consisting of a CheY-like receiver domain and a winged-helix DNA-binding domain